MSHSRIHMVINLVVVSLLLCGAALAEVPHLISYQGRLTSSTGVPYTGAKLVKFTIYDGTSAALWNSGFISVTFTDGLFEVKLGQSPQPALPVVNWATDTLLTVGITVDVDPEISPRTRFTTGAFAYQASHADNADKLGGQLPSAFASGWEISGSYLQEADTMKSVLIGTKSLAAGLQLRVRAKTGGFTASLFEANGSGIYDNAVRAFNASTTSAAGLFGVGSYLSTWNYPQAVSASCLGVTGGMAATFIADGNSGCIYARSLGTGAAISCSSDSGIGVFSDGWAGGYSGYFQRGRGVYVHSDSSRAAQFVSGYPSSNTHVIHAEFTNTSSSDAVAVYGKSTPADNWGFGGLFEGGFIGAEGLVAQNGGASYYGLYGNASGDGTGGKVAVYGVASGAGGSKFGVFGSASGGGTNYAGYFQGNCTVTGTLTKGAGAFRIDHPLDPANKYLQHSFVESPDMKNIYDGVITTDASGNATVTLSDWFGALNKDFRYQLTCIGQFAQAIVSSEIANNQFSIKTDKPNVKVSWMVTGIRHDAYAVAHPIQTELVKDEGDRNLYLHAEELGFAKEKGIDYRRQMEASVAAKRPTQNVAAAGQPLPQPIDVKRPESVSAPKRDQ